MIPSWVLFVAPALAIVLRTFLLVKFCLTSSAVPSEAELDRRGNRELILPLAGFSFTALLALVALDANRVSGLRGPILLLLLSFLGFYTSLNLQAYKVHRWQDQIATGLKEAASGWLILSVVAVVGTSPAVPAFRLGVSLLALAVWVLDFAIRYRIDYGYYRDTEAVR
jgi:hypothetical protein